MSAIVKIRVRMLWLVGGCHMIVSNGVVTRVICVVAHTAEVTLIGGHKTSFNNCRVERLVSRHSWELKVLLFYIDVHICIVRFRE